MGHRDGFPKQFRPPSGKEWDSVEAYFPVEPTPSNKPRWIVGWSPIVKQHKCPGTGDTVEIVHHMNIIDHAQDDENEHLQRFVSSYDRGAAPYRFPTGTTKNGEEHYLYGIPLGDKQLYLEYHLLKPHCWDWNIAKPTMEDSGFDLYLTSTPPLISNAALIGFTDADFKVYPNRGIADTTAQAAAKNLRNMFLRSDYQANDPTQRTKKTNLGKDGWPRGVSSIRVVAMHLHTHAIFQKKFFRIFDAKGKIKFKSTVEKTGYGKKQQSLVNLQDNPYKNWPRELFIHKGDVLEQHCMVNTKKLRQPFSDGTSWGFDMCAALFIVASKDITLPPMELNAGYCVEDTDDDEDCDPLQGTRYHLRGT